MVFFPYIQIVTSLIVQLVKNSCKAGDWDSVPGLGRFPGEGNGNPLQYSCLGNLMDRGAWQATVYGVARIEHSWVTKPPPPPHSIVLTTNLPTSSNILLLFISSWETLSVNLLLFCAHLASRGTVCLWSKVSVQGFCVTDSLVGYIHGILPQYQK